MADDDLHDRRDAAEYLRGLVLTGQLWRLPPARIEALERQGDDEQPTVH